MKTHAIASALSLCALTAAVNAHNLVGIDFNSRTRTTAGITVTPSTGESPTGWNTYVLPASVPADGSALTVPNLADVTGAASGFTLSIQGSRFLNDFGRNPSAAAIPLAETLPSGLSSSIDDYLTDTAAATFTFSGLEVGQAYFLYVIGLRAFNPLSNAVTVQGAGDAVTFTQFTTTPNELWINDQPGSSGADLSSYARVFTADAAGQLTITVDRTDAPFSWGIGGLGIQVVPTPGSTALLAAAALLAARRRRN